MSRRPTSVDSPNLQTTARIECGRSSAWLHGYGLCRLLAEIDSPGRWCPRYHALTCPLDRVADLLALLEHRDKRVVALTAVDR